MTVNVDQIVKLKTVHATLAAAEAGDPSVVFTLDPALAAKAVLDPTYIGPNFFVTSVQVRSAAGALKPGVLVLPYDRQGAGAGTLTIEDGTETFAIGDTVAITGRFSYLPG